MTSSEISQELELFDQTMSILDQATFKDEAHAQKIRQAALRLKGRVSLQDATTALEDATRRNNSDDRRIAQRGLSALLDTIPQDAALEVLKKGLMHPDPSTRASSVRKLSVSTSMDQDTVKAVVMRVLDVDTSVSKVVIEYIKKMIGDGENSTSQLIVHMLRRILAGELTGDGLSAESGTGVLRIWELFADLLKTSKSAYVSDMSLSILETLLAALETPNEDVLFVLNELEIAASLPRDIYRGKSAKLIQTLLRYATVEEMIADDALRVLAALHFSSENVATRPQFFEVLERRMSQEHFSLGSLEVFALFAGANAETFAHALDNQPRASQRWLFLVSKFAHDGNDVPRNVALDSLSKLIRGGSLLKDPLNQGSTVFVDDAASLADAEACAMYAWRFLKDDIPMLLKSTSAAIKSLHPQVQISGYLAIRMLVSQNSKWGITKVFEHISKDVLLGGNMPSPNSSYQAIDARKNAISSCALKFLDEEDDANLLNSIKQFVQASLHGTTYKLVNPSVDIATMRA
jgi:hypothetical protein